MTTTVLPIGDMWTGQTFTTGTNTQGDCLSSVAIQTGGGGSSGTGTAQPYELFIFSIESGNAKTIAHFSATNFAFTFGNWVQWSGFSLVLKSNATYAYGFGNDRTNSSFQSWAALAASPPTTDVYAGGRICPHTCQRWTADLRYHRPGGRGFRCGTSAYRRGAGPEAVCHPHHRFAFPDFGGRNLDDSE